MGNMSATNPSVFTSQAVAMINRAFARACVLVGAREEHQDIRVGLAKSIMHLARTGETDEGRLCDRSIAGMLENEAVRLRNASFVDQKATPQKQPLR